MKNILALYSSLSGDNAASTQLAKAWLSELDAQVIERDLAAQAIPHLDSGTFTGFITPAEQHSAEQAEGVALSDQLIDELEQSDTLLISVPMYNLGIPSTLKAWIDHIARAGRTFRYTEQGPQGLLSGKKAVVIATRGGQYQGTEYDVQTPYLRQILAFIGITEVEFIYAEGLAMGEDAKAGALSQAKSQLAKLAA